MPWPTALIGGAGADRITGGGGNDTLSGGDGLDTFIATSGDGNDAYNGGGSGDTYDLSGTTGPATVNLAAGTASSADTGSDTLSSIEHVIGTEQGDSLTGNDRANTLDGRGGNDIINAGDGRDIVLGGAGSDTLNGQAGSDTINGGADNDTVNGGSGSDRLVAEAGDGNDAYVGDAGSDTYDLSGTAAEATVNLATGTASSADTGSDTLATIENVSGSLGNDTLTGNSSANRLDGQDGDDTINGGGGADRLTGGLGDDVMDGGTGNDRFVFAPELRQRHDQRVRRQCGRRAGHARRLGLRLHRRRLRRPREPRGAGLRRTGGLDTLVTIDGVDSFALLGVNGVGTNSITAADFLLS